MHDMTRKFENFLSGPCSPFFWGRTDLAVVCRPDCESQIFLSIGRDVHVVLVLYANSSRGQALPAMLASFL